MAELCIIIMTVTKSVECSHMSNMFMLPWFWIAFG